MRNILFSLALKDLLTTPMLIVTFIPVILIFIVIFLMSTLFGIELFNYIYSEVIGYFNLTPQDIDEMLASNFILAFFAKLDFLVWIFKLFFYTVILYIGWNIAIIVGMIITGFFAPYIVKHVNRNYNLELKGHGNLLTTPLFLIKVILTSAVFFLLGIIFFWIPIINVLFFYFGFYYLFHKLLVSDVSGEINSAKEAKEIKRVKANAIRVHSFILYLLNNIPFIGILTQTYSLIYMSHFYLRESEKIRNERS